MPLQKCLLTAALLLAPAIARADLPQPVCGAPEVLEIVARMLNDRGLPAVVVVSPVGETPTARPDTVLCAVRLRREFFDTNRFGGVPQYRDRTYEYTVRRGSNGLFVTAAGG